MLVSDVMTTNVVTIPSDTSLADARRIIDAHKVRRLPVVDRGKLTGIVTRDALDRAGPSQLTTFSIHELTYLLSKLTVREVMVKNPVTISPTATVEEAVALAQSKKVGSLLVMDGGHLVGIATTNDFFYKLLNPILGIGVPGSRIMVRKCTSPDGIKRTLDIAVKLGARVVNMYTIASKDQEGQDLVVHVSAADPTAIVNELRNAGCQVEQRAR